MKKFKVKSKHKNNIKRSRKTLILCGKEKKSIFEDWIKIIIRYVSYLTAFFPKIQQLSLISYNKIYNCLAKLHLQTWMYITQLTSKKHLSVKKKIKNIIYLDYNSGCTNLILKIFIFHGVRSAAAGFYGNNPNNCAG